MATLFRSISVKIFGVAVGLRALIAATSLVSSGMSNQVHRQLRTLSESLFPLSMTIADVSRSALETRLAIASHARGELDPASCRVATAQHDAEGARLIKRALVLRQTGPDWRFWNATGWSCRALKC